MNMIGIKKDGYTKCHIFIIPKIILKISCQDSLIFIKLASVGVCVQQIGISKITTCYHSPGQRPAVFRRCVAARCKKGRVLCSIPCSILTSYRVRSYNPFPTSSRRPGASLLFLCKLGRSARTSV